MSTMINFVPFQIMMSVYGLVSESMAILMQRQPKELDKVLPECFQKVSYLN
jgi:zinc transporter 5/7